MLLRSILDDWFVESAGTLTYPVLRPYQESCCLPWVPTLVPSVDFWVWVAKGECTLPPGGPAQPPGGHKGSTRAVSAFLNLVQVQIHKRHSKDHMGTRKDTCMLHSCCQGNSYLLNRFFPDLPSEKLRDQQISPTGEVTAPSKEPSNLLTPPTPREGCCWQHKGRTAPRGF